MIDNSCNCLSRHRFATLGAALTMKCGRRPSCDHAWWACFRGHRVSLDKWAAYEVRTKSDAERAFDEMKAQIRAGAFRTSRIEAPKPALTIEALAPIYLEHHVKLRGLKSRRNVAQHLGAFAQAFPQPLSEITTLDVERFALRLRQEGRAEDARAQMGEPCNGALAEAERLVCVPARRHLK